MNIPVKQKPLISYIKQQIGHTVHLKALLSRFHHQAQDRNLIVAKPLKDQSVVTHAKKESHLTWVSKNKA